MNRHLLVVLAMLAALGGAVPASASEHLGTHHQQSVRRYCWKRIGLDPDATPTKHQAARLKPCVTKRLGRDDPYMDQF